VKKLTSKELLFGYPMPAPRWRCLIIYTANITNASTKQLIATIPPSRLAVSLPVPKKENTTPTIAIKNSEIAQFNILAPSDFIVASSRVHTQGLAIITVP
jgi:hypothetical protein